MASWLLAEEVAHRVANQYTAAIGSIARVAARCADRDARTALAGAAQRLLDQADVHRSLWPPRTPGLSDLGNYLRALCGAIVRADLAEQKILLTLIEEPIEIENDQCWLVGMIVSELISNAARHGLRHCGGGIVVGLSTQDGVVQCLVADDGASIKPTPGRGMQITRSLARQLGGRIDWVFTPSGTTVLLSFPLTAR